MIRYLAPAALVAMTIAVLVLVRFYVISPLVADIQAAERAYAEISTAYETVKGDLDRVTRFYENQLNGLGELRNEKNRVLELLQGTAK